MIVGIFGLPRSGKTTLLAKIAKKNQKKTKVYSNFACKGCYQLDFSQLGKRDFHDCVMLIDEISLICDSRDWKSFSSDLVYFFTHHGHYNITIYYCSQWMTDCDVKIRRMTEELIYVEKTLFGFSKRYRIERDIATNDSGDIVDTYRFRLGLPFLRRPYYSMFDSFVRKSLPPVKDELWTVV